MVDVKAQEYLETRQRVGAFLQAVAGDLIPIVLDLMVKPPEPEPPKLTEEHIILGYALPPVGESLVPTAPEGDGWRLEALDTLPDRILGQWSRIVQKVSIDAEFSDDAGKTDAPPPRTSPDNGEPPTSEAGSEPAPLL